jgi:thiol-disulfide isomerase/thioredoxin
VTIKVGSWAPAIPGADASGPRVLVFYKVTCPTCQMAAPKLEGFEEAYPGRVVGIGQDPDPDLEAFSRGHAMSFPSLSDLEPFDVSNAYGIEHVPTVVVVDADGVVADVVESWDRDGLNGASATMARLVGATPVPISDPSDGLPAFRPG